jgi:predicted amidohydrolase
MNMTPSSGSGIAVVQYAIGPLKNEQAFWTRIRRYIDKAVQQQAKLVVFPEYMTGHLLALHPPATNAEACEIVHSYTSAYKERFTTWSRETGLLLLAGTHIHREDAPEGKYYNEAFLFFPDGHIARHKKVHLTPEEQRAWPLQAGDRLDVFDTALGKIGIQICYDIEFPESTRLLAEQGAEIIVCPSYTDTEAGYYRVRNCGQARAVENQLYVALSGIVGRMPQVAQVDAGYCQAGVFAPCDRPFPPDGILTQGAVNRSSVATASADLLLLRLNRAEGGVAPFYDRRPELYAAVSAAVRTR